VNFDAFAHVIRAAADVSRDDLVVIGSQAILGQFPDAPAALLVSSELDVYPKNHPERADLIDGALGDGSPFHERFGYFAHGIGPETAIAPAAWGDRLVRIAVPGRKHAGVVVTAWCMEAHDLMLAKLAAGRPHDLEFVAGAITARLVTSHVLRQRAETMPISHRDAVAARLERVLAEAYRTD
jgi:hypothetical protein